MIDWIETIRNTFFIIIRCAELILWFGFAWGVANTARNKGFVAWRWYLYGLFFPLPAVIHSLLIKKISLPPLN